MRNATSVLLATVSLACLVAYVFVSTGAIDRDSLPVWGTKPLLMPALLAWLHARLRGRRVAEVRTAGIYAALVLCGAGDVCLIRPGTFLLGAAAFGLAHLCYVGSLLRLRHVRAALASWEILGLLALVAYAYLVAALVKDRLESAKQIAFAAYGAFVLATAASAFVRFVARGDRSSATILAGAALFLQSDSLIAVRVATLPLPLGPFAVMATYVAGQFLIARGVATTPDATEPGTGGILPGHERSRSSAG
ncbi:MAG TPA: lysoplasmalogenase [Planctomycetota bacterium]|nr:lysoplasmalogenase [Planctomycetota bacterium]